MLLPRKHGVLSALGHASSKAATLSQSPYAWMVCFYLRKASHLRKLRNAGSSRPVQGRLIVTQAIALTGSGDSLPPLLSSLKTAQRRCP